MTTTANPQSYQSPAWGRSWANQGWSEPPFWHPEGMSRPVGIALMVLGFALFWPIGLAILFFLMASGRIGCRRRRYWAQTQNGNGASYSMPPWTRAWGQWCGGGGNGGQKATPASGNRAFDEYRVETLRRLEEEQTEFAAFLDRLRFAKDKAEFDQFMADRRQTPRPPATLEDPPHA